MHAFFWWALAIGTYICSVYTLCWPGLLIVGYAQYMLLQVMHESIHQVFVRPGWKSFTMAFLHNFPLGVGRSYSALHMDHHRFFGEADKDPDYPTYIEYPKSKVNFIFILLQHLFGIKALKQILQWQEKTSADEYKIDKLFVILMQLGLLGLAFYFNRPWAYLVFWVLPLVTVVKALGYLRIVVEHGAPGGQVALRSLRGNKWLCNILGPYGFQYHAEHHKTPNKKYGQLGPMSDVEAFDGSHISYIWKMFWSLP